MSGVLPIVNCAGADLEIELDAGNGLVFDADGLTVAPTGTEVGFTISEGQFETGAIEIDVKVTQVGCCAEYVTVHAFKQGFDQDLVGDPELTAGEGEGGCKAGCITKAWVTGNPFHTDVQLSVETVVPATIRVYVSTNGPASNDASPAAASPAGATSLEATLTGLAPSTEHFVLIVATDDNGTSEYRNSFTTVTPAEPVDDVASNDPEPGCAAGCIVAASVEATGHDRALVTASMHTPATLDLFVEGDGEPLHVTSDQRYTEWVWTITGLAADTVYSIVLRATDENGRHDELSGGFTTPPAPPVPVEVSVDRIDIHGDGDGASWNAGEVRFGWTYDHEMIGQRGEQKLDDGAIVTIDDYHTVVAHLDADDATETFTVYAGERDGVGFGFCEAPHSALACEGITWNSASMGPMTLADIAALPLCSDYGFDGTHADDHCAVATSYDEGNDWVHMSAYFRFDLDG